MAAPSPPATAATTAPALAAAPAWPPPAAGRALDPAALARYPAVALFVERAAAVRRDFALTAENARAVAELCVRLDGLPLAIELAAARLRLLPLPALVERLTGRLHLLAALSGGPRDAPARQQTLRATVDWSYHLLDDAGRRLFQRLGAFAGGFTLDAVESLVRSPAPEDVADLGLAPADPLAGLGQAFGLDILEGLERLADASLLTRVEPPAAGPAGEVRFCLLETLREYALERLDASGEAAAVRRRHAAHFANLAEAAAQALRGPGQVAWLGRLAAAHDNLREALRWATTSDDPEAPVLGLRLVAALWRFWLVRGHGREGRRWAEGALRRGAGAPAPLRARALAAAGALAHAQGDDPAARREHQASMALWREVDPAGEATALRSLGGVAGDQAGYDTARDLYEASLASRRMLGDRASIAQLLRDLGSASYDRRDFAAARSRFEQSLGILRELGDDVGVAETLLLLGSSVRAEGDPAQAETCCAQSLALFRAAGSTWGEAVSLAVLGEAAHDTGRAQEGAALLAHSVGLLRELSDEQTLAYELFRLAEVVLDLGDAAAAATLCREGLARVGAVGNERRLAAGLETASGLALARGDPAQAAVLLGAAGHLRETLGALLVPADRQRNDRRGAATRAALGDDAFAAAQEAGRLLPLPQVIERALAELADTPPAAAVPRDPDARPAPAATSGAAGDRS